MTWSTIDCGGTIVSSGGQFTLGGTIGQSDAGLMVGGDYTLGGGFWGGGARQSGPEHHIFLPIVLANAQPPQADLIFHNGTVLKMGGIPGRPRLTPCEHYAEGFSDPENPWATLDDGDRSACCVACGFQILLRAPDTVLRVTPDPQVPDLW
jgi:hypothetical protein